VQQRSKQGRFYLSMNRDDREQIHEAAVQALIVSKTIADALTDLEGMSKLDPHPDSPALDASGSRPATFAGKIQKPPKPRILRSGPCRS
jgi:hypothetical protein